MENLIFFVEIHILKVYYRYGYTNHSNYPPGSHNLLLESRQLPCLHGQSPLDGRQVTCPRCGSDNVRYLPNARVFKCFQKHPCQKFSLKVGTVFEDSPIGLDKWLPVMWMLANCKNGVSSWEIHRAVGVTQKTAWFMLQRARLAMQDSRQAGS